MTAPFYRFSEFDGEEDAADERWALLAEPLHLIAFGLTLCLVATVLFGGAR